MLDNENLCRLRWHCRRGSLELDVLLGYFLENRYAELSPELQTAFTILLAHSDQELINWLVARDSQPEDANLQPIVSLLRSIKLVNP